MAEIFHPLQPAPVAPDTPPAEPRSVSDETPSGSLDVRPLPLFSYALTVLLLVIFVLELEFTVDPSGLQFALTPHSLYVLGGLSGPALKASWDYWRFATGPLLHASGPHVVFNCIALVIIAPALERAAGWRWTAAIFVIAAIVGEVAILLVYPWGIVAVGASGGIAGLYTAALPLSLSMPRGRIQRSLALRSMIGTVLFFLTSQPAHRMVAGMQVADAAHVAGLAVGLVLGFVLAATMRRPTATLRFQRTAVIIVALFAVVALGSLAPLILRYDGWKSASRAVAVNTISRFGHAGGGATPWGKTIGPGEIVQTEPAEN